MIPLEKSEKLEADYEAWLAPSRQELEDHLAGYLTNEKSDWIAQKHREAIQELLFPTCHGKCVYCEREPDTLEIDHFYPKKVPEFRNKAFLLSNLLPCCGKCNKAKAQRFSHDDHEMLDPYKVTEIREHLALDLESLDLEGISGKGTATTTILAKSLNVTIDNLGKRKQAAKYLRRKEQANLDKSLTRLIEKRNNHELVVYGLTALLEKIDPSEPFTAVRATLLFAHEKFGALIRHLAEKDPEQLAPLQHMVRVKRHYCLGTIETSKSG